MGRYHPRTQGVMRSRQTTTRLWASVAACALALTLLLADATPAPCAEPPLKLLEEKAMERLDRTVRAHLEAGGAIEPFTTDGCSGGLSDAWASTARLFPPFAENFGDTPPWEGCCVAHDRIYWKGETLDGYEKRLAADQELRDCVVRTGERDASELSVKLRIAPGDVRRAFGTAAELIYVAVRAGGAPCSGLGWRWGYGWPGCFPGTGR